MRDYIKNNGEDALKQLLKKSGDVQLCHEFNDELEKWYNDNGLVLNNPLSEVLYSYGGYSYQYIVYNRYAVFYMDRDWKDSIDIFLSEDFLHKDYAQTKKFYEINTEQMRQYNELFELEGTVLDVPILISHTKSRNNDDSYQGIYYPDIKMIYTRSVTALTHEYIHALTVPICVNQSWVFEGWATAYEYRYNYYKPKAYSYFMNNEDYIFLKEYIEKKGSPIDMVTDYKIVGDLMVYGKNDYDYKKGYTPAASFFRYLSDVYGEKKIIDYVCYNHDLTTVTDKSLDELAEDWKNYMEEKYSEYSKME